MSSSGLPEFFFDRGLGRRTAQSLREHGWTIHLMADHYPDDGDRVEDADWIAAGCERGWALVSKDRRIRYRRQELEALDGHLFCLSSGTLTIRQTVDRLLLAGPRMRAACRGGPGLWIVYDEGRIERRWP